MGLDRSAVAPTQSGRYSTNANLKTSKREILTQRIVTSSADKQADDLNILDILLEKDFAANHQIVSTGGALSSR